MVSRTVATRPSLYEWSDERAAAARGLQPRIIKVKLVALGSYVRFCMVALVGGVWGMRALNKWNAAVYMPT